ncbi:thioredoxin [Solirubrobacter sp. CPCC 204708]|uniref:Thioredoxin n=1 Tax=Solirubrobacter deserti TaxID=2282478 RepID=A0ABT4RV11_9ACTN|nr:thioredoxin [Solirubrobacter deserti]MBE2315144.1 thioredoxin [Solirubrobacter deserti]MDA0142395.1 thioredoxin [Solirubrobacter deserti]
MPIDATDTTFEQAVIQRSYEKPVVVDFWAEWCGPCRMLGPVIEKAVEERGDAVELVKIDTDANPRVSQQFGIQSIPAVKAFKDGKVVDEFVGALPPAQVNRFLDRIVPSEADALVADGGEANLRRALELEPTRVDAKVALARLVPREEALQLLANSTGFAAEGLAAQLRLEEDPNLAEAFAAIDRGDTETGLDTLIGAIPASTGEQREDLRRAVVGVLDDLGVEHPVAREARRKLASALY